MSSTGPIPGPIPETEYQITRRRELKGLPILNTPPEERFGQVIRVVKRVFGVESVAIKLIGGGGLSYKSQVEINTPEDTMRDAFFDVTIGQSEILMVPDALEDPRFSNTPLVTSIPKIRFYAGCPLKGFNGELLGVLCIFDSTPRVLTDLEKEQLGELALRLRNEILAAQELDRAAEVQRGLLPKQLVSLPGYQVAGAYLSAEVVGGDFYDWYPVKEGAAFTLADVMGKGIGAAIIAATVRAVLRAGSRQGGVCEAVEGVAETLQSDLDEAGAFVTLIHGCLDVETGVVEYVDAGHGLTLIVHANGRTDRLATTNFPLGLGINDLWKIETVTLDHGDTLIAVSDGVLDIFDGTLASLEEVAKVVRGSASAQAVVDTLVSMAGGVSTPDDVSMLVLRRS